MYKIIPVCELCQACYPQTDCVSVEDVPPREPWILFRIPKEGSRELTTMPWDEHKARDGKHGFFCSEICLEHFASAVRQKGYRPGSARMWPAPEGLRSKLRVGHGTPCTTP